MYNTNMDKLILIIEDNKTIAMYEKHTLVNAGHNVIVAHNLEETQDLVKKHYKEITLCIVDINLPDTQDEVLTFLLKRNLPSIAMTGSFHPKLRNKIVDKNVIDYIVLEDDQQLELLQATVNRIINNKERKILIVDDSRSSRFALKNLLGFQNFTILEAPDAQQALKILQDNNDISIALVDYEMPGMNGAELTRIIRKSFSRMELSIFAISVHTEPIITIEFLKAGANDFITKPYVKEEVLARIGVNIDMMDQHQQLEKEIKERHKIEKELKEAKETAQNANEAKSNFLANMSHEIRTPMNAIIGFVDILCKNEESIEKLSHLNIIKKSGGSLINIINDILDFSKIESKKTELDNHIFITKEPFNLVMQLFKAKAEENNINLNLHIDSELPKKAYGDTTRIKQILSNLLSNAIKFSNEDSKINVNISYKKDENKLCCSVKDYGIGIAQKNFDKVFKIFEQEDNTTTRKYGGSGLGLPISKALAKMMNGDIIIESELNKGSTFYFSIEIFKDIQKYITADDEEQNNKNIYDLDTPLDANVLLVEDNKSNQLLMGILLDDLGLRFKIANDGVEAVDLFQVNDYDLILMDENMPNMNGIEATNRIRSMKDKKQVPIIAVTANALKGDKERFLDAGMDDYISKPIDSDKLELVIRKYLS